MDHIDGNVNSFRSPSDKLAIVQPANIKIIIIMVRFVTSVYTR